MRTISQQRLRDSRRPRKQYLQDTSQRYLLEHPEPCYLLVFNTKKIARYHPELIGSFDKSAEERTKMLFPKSHSSGQYKQRWRVPEHPMHLLPSQPRTQLGQCWRNESCRTSFCGAILQCLGGIWSNQISEDPGGILSRFIEFIRSYSKRSGRCIILIDA